MGVTAPSRAFREINKGELHLNLHAGQERADRSTARIVAMLAGTQGGKTCYGPHWLYDRIMETKKEGEDNDYLAITATFPLLKLKMLKEFKMVFEQILKLGEYKDADKVFLSHDKYHGAELWRVIFGSATNPESIESATAKAAWLDEAGQKQFRRQSWEAVWRRLAIFQGRVLITTTLYGLGWLKTEIHDRAEAGDESIELIQFGSTINPAFPQSEYQRAIDTMPKWKVDMFYRGIYSTPAGLIYDSFNESICRIKRFNLPKEWPRYSGHDFGGANPAAVFYAVDPGTGYIYAYHEYLPGGGKSTAQHVEAFKEITAGCNVIKRAGGAHQEEEIRQGYTAHGWPIQEPKVHSVEAQIDRVYALHKLNKLFIFDDLYTYLDEKQSYSRALDDNYKPTDEIENKSAYHLLDAERYILSDFTPETVVGGETSPVWSY